jgi:hypothetical protein
LSQSGIRGEELAADVLGEGHVARVVDREVAAKVEDAPQQPLMSVSGDRKVSIVFERRLNATVVDDSSNDSAPQPGCDLDVAQRRDMKIVVGPP